MATATEIREKLKAERLAYAKGIQGLEAKNWDRLLPVDRIPLPSDPEVTLYIFSNGSFRASDEKIYEDPSQVMEIFELLRPISGTVHADFFEGYDALAAKEKEFEPIFIEDDFLATLEHHHAQLPQLKEDILKLAEMFSRGEDVSAWLKEKRNSF